MIQGLRALACTVALLAAAACSDGTSSPVNGGAVAGDKTFDFYVLALSWSPSYCAAEGSRADPTQCQSQRPYAFIVHGLWPQFEQGWPEFCAVGDRNVDEGTVKRMMDVMPSVGLVRHQWRKHGTCSGLGQEAFFELVRQARTRIAIPAAFDGTGSSRTVSPVEVQTAFQSSNAGLGDAMMSVTCDGRFLREVRICLDQALEFRDCPEVAARSCRRDKVLMPAARGG